MGTHDYLGVLRNTHDPVRRQIHVLGEFVQHPNEDLEVPAGGFENFIGPTGQVHWYQNHFDSVEFNRLNEHELVRFTCDKDYRNEKADEGADWRRVHQLEVNPFGAYVLPESDCRGWQSGSPITSALRGLTGTCYIKLTQGDEIVGPWRIKQNGDSVSLEPKRPPIVNAYRLTTLKVTFAIKLYEHPSLPGVKVIGIQDFPIDGSTVDVANPTQLSNWFKKKLGQVVSAEKTKELNTAYPGWRTSLAEAVKLGTPDEVQKWERVQNNLEAILADANAIEAILQTKAFEDKVKDAIQLKVEQKSKEILEEAKATANSKIARLTEELEALSLRRDSLENEIVAEEERLRKPCLLYTSPSPRDQRGSRMPSSA